MFLIAKINCIIYSWHYFFATGSTFFRIHVFIECLYLLLEMIMINHKMLKKLLRKAVFYFTFFRQSFFHKKLHLYELCIVKKLQMIFASVLDLLKICDNSLCPFGLETSSIAICCVVGCWQFNISVAFCTELSLAHFNFDLV